MRLARSVLAGGMAAIGLALALPARGNDVRAGVEAWSRGDHAAAVALWMGPAEAGDADARFNLAQAYRLGRGVPRDEARAEALYAAAAAQGHIQAADIYGLMLFQDGRREAALPYVQAAARRGDPRAQYLLGVAHFNGDAVPRDWQRAYALLTLANAAGLPQAAAALAEMDQHVPLADRQQAVALAGQLEREAIAAREVELAAADLAMAQAPAGPSASSGAAQAQPASRVPRPISTIAISPSVAASREALEEALRATGLESPANAGASFATAPMAAPMPTGAPAGGPTPVPAPAPAPAVAAPPAAPPAQVAAGGGAWRVQLGAFSQRANAEGLWNRLAGRPELAGRERLLITAGAVTRLQAGGYASRAEAQAACRGLKADGVDCLVTGG